MNRRSRQIFFVCTGAYFLAQASGASAMAAGTAHPPYAQIADGLVALAQAEPGWATAMDYGLTPEGRPLRALRIEDPRRPASHKRPAVLITGTTHGDEYLHIEDRLAAWFLDHREGRGGTAEFFAAGGVLLIVPIVNPDAFAANQRDNSHKVDLNRDFAQPQQHVAGFEEPESRLLARWLAAELSSQDLDLRMTLDYHCCAGALLLPRSYNQAAVTPTEAALFAKISRLVPQEIDSTYRYGSSDKILGYDAVGTSKDYYRETYGSLSFTFEGRQNSEASRFAQHAQWWDQVLPLLVVEPSVLAQSQASADN